MSAILVLWATRRRLWGIKDPTKATPEKIANARPGDEPQSLWRHCRTCGALPGIRFKSKVKEVREERGYTQEALAREAGVSRQTIINIERGLSEPRVLLAITIAAILGVAVADLFRQRRGSEVCSHECQSQSRHHGYVHAARRDRVKP